MARITDVHKAGGCRMLVRPNLEKVAQVVRMALDEDAPWGDLTSDYLIPEEAQITAELVAREAGVLCGEDFFATAMSMCGPVHTTFTRHDGELIEKGFVIASVSGPAPSVLRAERVALNFLQRLSGIATLTARFVAQVEGTPARIVDTRKTTPGLRLFERYAVRCGGGHNHRFSLSDAVMLKDNHLQVLKNAEREHFSERLRLFLGNLPHTSHVEIEVDRLDQIEDALSVKVNTIMLDNFSLQDLREGVRQVAGRALVEASGGVTLESVRAIASTGVDLISVGALTHSARALDFGLDMQT